MKKVLIFLILAAIGAAYYVYKDYILAPVRILPVTYMVEKAIFDVGDVEASNVLIIGDQMGEKLASYIPEMIQEVSKSLEEPLKVANLTATNEGMHRTLAKVKQIPELPEIIIYHAGFSEFFERKFNINQYDRILKNLATFEDEKKISLIMTFPLLSKVLYRPTAIFSLNEKIEEDKSNYPAKFKMQQMELTYKFYDLELDQLIKYVKDQNKTLVLITSPINLILPPKKVCQNTTTESINEELFEFEERLKKGESKLIVSDLEKYAKAAIGNARAFHLLGITYLTLGRLKNAKLALEKAALFDCENWRPSTVFNSILKKHARNHDLFIIDFAESVHNQLGSNEQFLHQDYPHDIYYNESITKITEIIKKVLDL